MRLADELSNRIAASPLTNDKTPANHRPEAQAIVLMRRANPLGASILGTITSTLAPSHAQKKTIL